MQTLREVHSLDRSACVGSESTDKASQGNRQARQEGRSLDPLIPFRLAVLSNATIDLIVPALIARLHGTALLLK